MAHRVLVLSMMYENTVTRHWDPELQKIDPLLRLRRAKEHAAAPGVTPDFYHLLRLNREGPIWVLPLTWPDGSFAEPTSQMLEGLRACDLQNDRVVRDRVAADELAAKRAERAKENNREDLADEGDERWAAYSRTQVLTSPDVAWAQNSAGRSRPTRGKGR
ncbi:MAG TPA: hypothetical protein VE645_19205 [Pseudonocardiaceae bacterium]|nr:hypothetical protein [Pseudonocardiaceae bacterium]